jgi:hypothetical protein
MSRQHQDSFLPRSAQGEEGYETAAKYRCLVRINSVPHTADIHLPHPKIALRNSFKGWTTGGRCRTCLRIQ